MRKCELQLHRSIVKIEDIDNAPVGKNPMSKFPSEIAKWLKLPNPAHYTGHSLCWTTATEFADSGSGKLAMKCQLQWSSDSIAEGYIAQSKKFKMQMASALAGEEVVTTSN